MFVSKDETRYYLKGVNIQFNHDHVIMCATNGHYLALMRHQLNEPLDSPIQDTIVPVELIDRIKPSKHLDYCELYVDGRTVKITYAGATYAENAIDGSFPDYRRVIPASISGEVSQFDPAYIALFGKAKTLLTGIKQPLIGVSHNGLSPALINFIPDTEELSGFGVLMPVRPQDCLKAPPAWSGVIGSSVAQAA